MPGRSWHSRLLESFLTLTLYWVQKHQWKWDMSKKKKNQAKKVLSSFADLGNTGKNTLSRLATTVKADMPTVLLGNKDTIKTDGINLVGGNRVSRIANRLNPFNASPGKVQAKPAAARLKHIAGKMGHAAMPKTRKSKGVIWIVAFFFALAGAGYYGWTKMEGLGDKVVQMVDYKSWLDKTAGKVKPETTRTVDARSERSVKSHTAVKQNTEKQSRTVSVTTKTFSVKKSSANASIGKKVSGKQTVAKAKNKKPSTKQKQQWENRLAKLKKKSEAEYRRASANYRNNHK